MGGYSSQTLDEEVITLLEEDDRESVLIYAGDLDPSGEDILRNLTRHVDFDNVEHIAITLEQIDSLGLTEWPGKVTDPRARKFTAKYGRLFQVEVEAIEPDTLKSL